MALLQACTGNEADRDADSTDIQADNAPVSSQLNSSTPAASDTAFANKAVIGGMAEVALGKMAAAKGASSEVRNFGKMMVSDHTKANEELMGIAKKNNISLPTGLDAEHQAKSDSLNKLSGKDFDKAYIKAMVDDHQRTLAIMNKQASGGQDVDFKAFAVKTAPIVKHHLDEIMKMQ